MQVEDAGGGLSYQDSLDREWSNMFDGDHIQLQIKKFFQLDTVQQMRGLKSWPTALLESSRGRSESVDTRKIGDAAKNIIRM